MDALTEYLDEIGAISNYVPAGAPSISAVTKGDMGKRLQYATSTIGTIWEAMPTAYRKQALNQLKDFSKKLAEGSIDISAALSSMEGLSDMGGPVISAITSIVTFAVQASRVNTAISRYAMATGKMVGRVLTMYDEPRPISGDILESMKTGEYELNPHDWVKVVKIRGYIRYVKPERKPTYWSWEPSVLPLEGLTEMFGWNYGSPKGRWKEGSGIPMVCGLGSAVFNGVLDSWGGCHPPGKESTRAEYRAESFNHCYTLMNPTSYPWGFMSMQPGPYEVPCFADQGCEDDMVNGIFMRRQFEMLSVARVNMRSNGSFIKHMAKKMSGWLGSRLWMRDDLLAIDKTGNVTGGYGQQTLYIDREFDSDNKGSSVSRRWYVDADGVIREYENYSDVPTPDLTTVGFQYGSQTITLAQYNAVIKGALAFFTFRRICLLDRNACRAWVEEGFDKNLGDPGLGAAIRASAKMKTTVAAAGGFAAPSTQAPPRAKDAPARAPTVSGTSPRGEKNPRTSFRDGVDTKPPASTRIAAAVAGFTGLGALGFGAYILSRRFL